MVIGIFLGGHCISKFYGMHLFKFLTQFVVSYFILKSQIIIIMQLGVICSVRYDVSEISTPIGFYPGFSYGSHNPG